MTEYRTKQLARLAARDLSEFEAALLKMVQLYADTEAGRKGRGSPVLARLVLTNIEIDVEMLLRQLEMGCEI